MEFEEFYYSLPKFTRFYMMSVFVITFMFTYIKSSFISYILLDFDQVFSYFHIWRLFTNFFFVGKFSFNFVFFMLMIYNTLSRLEKKSVENSRYAEFIMMIIYTAGFILLVSWFMTYVFGLDPKYFLSFEMLFALIYIESKRDPEKIVMIWMITCKNGYVPFVLLFFSLLTGGDIVSDLVGIASGHLYFYLKDLAPLHHNLDLLKTPQFLNNYFNNSPNSRVRPTFSSFNNSNSSASFGNPSSAQSNPQSNPSANMQDNSASGNRFQPFSGRGTSWG